MSYRPRVSIIIPVYNGSNYLRKAIKSALAQTYKNIEIIVVNDGSTDNGATRAIAMSFGDKIKYYEKKNGGVASALNLAIEKMTGEYFSWLSHDDMYKPDKIKKQIAYINTLPDKKVILYMDYDLVDEKGDFISRCNLDHEMLENKPIYSLLRGSINGITLLIPKSAFDEYGKFDESLRCTQDYEMWYRMMKTYRFIHKKSVLTMTRIHPNQGTFSDPAAITEGNELWISMIKGLSDEDKINTEGSLFSFYFEMIKFLKNTPYLKALEYCKKALDNQNKTNLDINYDRGNIFNVYQDLLAEQLPVSASLYLTSAVKDAHNKGKTKFIQKVINNILIGDVPDVGKKNKDNLYISKLSKRKQKKRLLFCSGHWLSGGMERVLSVLFEQLNNEYEIFLLTPSDGTHGKIELPAYVTNLIMSNEHFYSDLYEHIALSYALIFEVDVVIGFMHLAGRQLELYGLCHDAGVRTIAANNEMYFYPYESPPYYNFVQKRLNAFKVVDAVLWPTNFSAATYGLAANNSYLIPNPNPFKPKEVIHDSEQKIILSVGRFNDYIKRVDKILDCFSKISKKDSEAKLILVGKCDRNAPLQWTEGMTINDLVKKSSVDETKIEFVGEVEDVTEYYRKATLLLVTSKSEGFGMVINEAASFGVPTVCTRVPGLEDLITDDENGYIVDQEDMGAMVEKVRSILLKPMLRHRLSKNAVEMVARFDSDIIGDKWKYLIHALTDLDIREKRDSTLRAQLSYDINYEKMSHTLFDEINTVIASSIAYYNEQNRPEKNKSKFVKRRESVVRDIRTKGFIRTGIIISKAAYRKARSSK
jgi:glycosyltransferase involved in cell wall biosynthesis